MPGSAREPRQCGGGIAGLGLAAGFCLAALAFTIQIDRLQKYQPPRAVVAVRYFADWPLMFYLDVHHASGRLPPLREIDLVGSVSNADRYARRLLPSSFRRVESKPVSWNFTLTRFRSAAPVAVPLRVLQQGVLVGGGRVASVLVQGE